MAVDEERVLEAAKWAAEEYERRTRAIGNDEKVSLYWVPANNRVDWHEIASKFKLTDHCVDNRLAFQSPFEAEMKKRKLLRVLKGKMTAVEWVEKYG